MASRQKAEEMEVKAAAKVEEVEERGRGGGRGTDNNQSQTRVEADGLLAQQEDMIQQEIEAQAERRP